MISGREIDDTSHRQPDCMPESVLTAISPESIMAQCKHWRKDCSSSFIGTQKGDDNDDKEIKKEKGLF